MSDFKTRLLEERTQLGEKIAKLKTFIEGESFNQIDTIQRHLLRIQYNAMIVYWECLDSRLNHLP